MLHANKVSRWSHVHDRQQGTVHEDVRRLERDIICGAAALDLNCGRSRNQGVQLPTAARFPLTVQSAYVSAVAPLLIE